MSIAHQTVALGLAAVACMTPRAALGVQTLYVAPNGDDTWSGTVANPTAKRTDGPFASIGRARDAIRYIETAGAAEAGLAESRLSRYVQRRDFPMAKGRKRQALTDSITSANTGFEEEMARLSAKLGEQFTGSARLARAIRENLEGLGYGV